MRFSTETTSRATGRYRIRSPSRFLATIALLAFVGCSAAEDTTYQPSVLKAVKNIQDTVNSHDLAKFSRLAGRADTVGFFKVLSLLGSLYESGPGGGPVITLTPIEFSPETISTGDTQNIRVKLTIAYSGTLTYLGRLSGVLLRNVNPIINMGMPSELELTFAHRGLDYKLVGYGYPLLYDLILKGIELVI